MKLIDEYRPLIEKRLDGLLPKSGYSDCADAMRYSLLSGGKRIRPILLLEFYKLCGGEGLSALDFAAVVEMIHTYSLIHDDLPCMDNHDMRRGRPSCHKAFGEDTALLAGDALLTLAFSVAAGTKGIDADRLTRAIKILSDKAGICGMIGGQVMDLKFEKTGAAPDELKEMYLKKTGCLLETAAMCGCVLAGADETVVAAASEYAKCVGLAFQIIDDILDCTADEKVFGKPVGSDEKNGKITYVTVFGLDNSKKLAAELTDKAVKILEEFDGNTETLKEFTRYLLNRNY